MGHYSQALTNVQTLIEQINDKYNFLENQQSSDKPTILYLFYKSFYFLAKVQKKLCYFNESEKTCNFLIDLVIQ